MGYTHYWRQKESIPVLHWKQITEEVRKVLAAPELYGVVRGPSGEGDPVVNDYEIAFNGDLAKDEDCETFKIDRVLPLFMNREQQDSRGPLCFTKTREMPYDIAVCAALIIAAHVTEKKQLFHLSSDGDARDWQPALDLVTHCCGSGYKMPKAIQTRESIEETTREYKAPAPLEVLRRHKDGAPKVF